MLLSFLIDWLGVGVLFWAIGRIFFHLFLLNLETKHSARKIKAYYISTWLFYILGGFSSLLIGLIDGMCHKRLYHIHLQDLRTMKSFVPFDIRNREKFEEFCDLHGIGPHDSIAPMDIPISWYMIY